MDNNYDYEYDWDDQYYGTGPTQPPKSRGGLIALMLILVIFLIGIVTVLGILNIRMFRELKVQQRKNSELSIAFTTEATAPPETVPYAAITEEIGPAQAETVYTSMSIEPSPKGMDNIPMEGGLSLQDIYTHNIGSVVSITCDRYGASSTGTLSTTQCRYSL